MYLLALSWLSAESEPITEDPRKHLVIAGGQKVLTVNGIRDDGVWVNRSEMFDVLTDGWNRRKPRGDADTLLSFILSANRNDFLEIPAPKKSKKKIDDTDEEPDQE